MSFNRKTRRTMQALGRKAKAPEDDRGREKHRASMAELTAARVLTLKEEGATDIAWYMDENTWKPYVTYRVGDEQKLEVLD